MTEIEKQKLAIAVGEKFIDAWSQLKELIKQSIAHSLPILEQIEEQGKEAGVLLADARARIAAIAEGD